jgi:hypothetical protein
MPLPLHMQHMGSALSCAALSLRHRGVWYQARYGWVALRLASYACLASTP